MFPGTRRAVPGIVLIAGLAATSAQAWQRDVHDWMTRYLAALAGYSAGEALAIARANQNQDDLESRNAIPLVVRLLITPSRAHAVKLSGDVRNWHFPADAGVPAPPADRKVAPMSEHAQKAIVDCLGIERKEAKLDCLGAALHAYQDSWSHGGEPDTPVPWRKDLVWSHPVSRGGWRLTKADLTHLDKKRVAEAGEVAKATFSVLSNVLQGTSIPAPQPLPAGVEESLRKCFWQGDETGKRDCYSQLSPGLFAGPDLRPMPPANPPKRGLHRQAPTIKGMSIPGDRIPKDNSRVPEAAKEKARRFLDAIFRKADAAEAGRYISPDLMQIPETVLRPGARSSDLLEMKAADKDLGWPSILAQPEIGFDSVVVADIELDESDRIAMAGAYVYAYVVEDSPERAELIVQGGEEANYDILLRYAFGGGEEPAADMIRQLSPVY